MSKDAYRSMEEAMTAEELAAAQNTHYRLDDQIRWGLGKMTIAQKQSVLEFITKLVPQVEA